MHLNGKPYVREHSYTINIPFPVRSPCCLSYLMTPWQAQLTDWSRRTPRTWPLVRWKGRRTEWCKHLDFVEGGSGDSAWETDLLTKSGGKERFRHCELQFNWYAKEMQIYVLKQNSFGQGSQKAFMNLFWLVLINSAWGFMQFSSAQLAKNRSNDLSQVISMPDLKIKSWVFSNNSIASKCVLSYHLL